MSGCRSGTSGQLPRSSSRSSRAPGGRVGMPAPTRLFAGARWDKLRGKGARVQRLLWASTGTKNKSYSDVLYVDELIAPDTVNTLPPVTMDAFRDHGKPRQSLEENIERAEEVVAAL